MLKLEEKTVLALLAALIVAIIYAVSPAQSDEDRGIVPDGSLMDKVVTEQQHESLVLPADILVITNGTVIDGAGAEPIFDGLVAIQEDRILAVGRAADFTIPAGAEIIDAAGGTIMPGIINAHVHNTHSPDTRSRFLSSGVTATCDLATSLNDMAQFEQMYNYKHQPAARGFYTGPMITAPGGYPASYGLRWDYQVATPTEARAAATEIISLGADMIKVALEPWQPQDPWPVLNLEQLQAVVETAHSFGVPVRAHVQQAEMLDMALQAGVDSVEHIPLPFPEEFKLKQMDDQEEHLSLNDFPEYEAQLARMANQGISLVPTLNMGSCATYDLPELESKARRNMCNFQLEIVKHFQEMGGVVALGNDYGNLGPPPDMPLREMELLLAAGLSPLSIIEAGTEHAAKVCGHADELGTLEPGKLADIILVDGDPLADIAAMSRVSVVIKGGETAPKK